MSCGERPKRYHIWTIGCQMNSSDARSLADELEGRGYSPASSVDEADIIVLITCVVRQSAEDKAIGRIRSLRPLKLRRPGVIFAVMGCLVGMQPDLLSEQFPHVDLFLPPSRPEPLLAHLDEQYPRDSKSHPPTPAPVSAYIPISYGCDHHCTYCIVRLRRGSQASRPPAEIIEESAEMVARGAREITLLGQNVDAYGVDLPGKPDLADLLARLHDLQGLLRLRFLTSHPSDMGDRILDAVASLPKVCEHIELPVQSGSDGVLRRMGRNYSAAGYLELVSRIRGRVPHVSLGTDVIVGFPGETEADYGMTRALVEEVRFDVVHIAAYSVRAGTPAERLADDVPAETKESRRKDLENLQERISGEINSGLSGKPVEVLVEEQKRGRWRGRTRNNKLVFFDVDDGDVAGRLVKVRINWAGPWSMIGERLET